MINFFDPRSSECCNAIYLSNTNAMELYQLKGFVAVAGEGHLTRAADKLHVSQPALSAQIKALEDELGVTLFERGPTRMALTSAGKRLVTAAQDVIAAANAMAHDARTLSGEIAGRIRLGTVAEPEWVQLPALLATLAREPWILTPPTSTHRVLAQGLFREHGVTPATLMEADNEGVIRSLVVAGLGVALMRDSAAAALVDSGEACLWEGAELPTELQFIWREEVGGDPATRALLDLVRETWPLAHSKSTHAGAERRLRRA
jgi:DNA-binding transcriptional LysR family regulator